MKNVLKTSLFCGTMFISTASFAASLPTFVENFTTPWVYNSHNSAPTSADGAMKVDGPWIATGGDYFVPGNVGFSKNSQKLPVLTMTVPAGKPGPNGTYEGAEIISVPGTSNNGTTSPYRAGYYEVSMQSSCVGSSRTSPPTGSVSAFFTIGVGYISPEIDVEILGSDNADLSSNNGIVHLTIHDAKGGTSTDALQLPFNPCRGEHRYGYLWSANGNIQYTIDGKAKLSNGKPVTSYTDPAMAPPADGVYIMANAWTGTSTWGGVGVPTAAITQYRWIKYGAHSTSVPNW
jgi:hypothetical protein